LDAGADTARAGVVVVAGIARLPPQVEPRFGMLVTPQQHGRTGAGAVETAGLDQLRRPPGPFRALLRRQRPVAGGDRPQARGALLPRRHAHGPRSYAAPPGGTRAARRGRAP